MKAFKTEPRPPAQQYRKRNLERAERISILLRRAAKMGWYDGEALDRASNVADLLADIRHYCDRHDLDFADLDARAYNNYCAEVVEAQTGEAQF